VWASYGLPDAWRNGRMSGEIRVATRCSWLALWQAEHVAARLRAAHQGLEVRLLPMVTEGDRIVDRALASAGGKGLFIKELETAILAGQADIAVHSMKDVPAALPDGMAITAVLERADPRDAFVSRLHAKFAELPMGACVGTSSLRKMDEGEFALVLIGIGLSSLRLGTIEHRRDLKAMREQYPGMPRSMSAMIAVLIAVLGLAALLAVIFRS